MMRRGKLIADRTGSTATEFAFVAPVFIMFVFLLLDGGRMLFTQQALNELAFATARCAAVKSGSCTTATQAASWGAARGRSRSQLQLSDSMVSVTPSALCNGQGNMVQATITMPWKKGAMTLLPQKMAPSQLVATACFPVAASS